MDDLDQMIADHPPVPFADLVAAMERVRRLTLALEGIKEKSIEGLREGYARDTLSIIWDRADQALEENPNG